MGASFFLKCYSLVFISLLLGFFSISEVDFKSESQPFVSLFSKSSYMCHSDSINYAFDKTISKNEYTLCQLGYENFCKRRNPVEEQESFYVVCPIYSVSQASHKLLYELHTNFKYYCHSLGVKFVQIEYAFPYQDFILTKPQNEPFDIQIPGRNIFYLRENLINVAEKKLPQDYEYIAWIDAHVHFDNPYIFQQMIVELGKSKIVAPHSIVEFKDKTNKTLQSKSYPYVYQVYYQEAKPKFDVRYNKKFDIFPFYGLAFATTKHVFRKMDGVPDICIAGNCDVYMSIALINGHVPKSHKKIYGDKIANWIKQTSKIINGEFKYIKSSITHFDHSFPLRKQSNWADAADLLAKRNFNWERDLRRDENETLYFVDNFELAYDFWKFYSSI